MSSVAYRLTRIHRSLDDAIRLEMSVEDALKMIVSGGLVTPPRRG